MLFTDSQVLNKKAYEALKRIRSTKSREEQHLISESSNLNFKQRYNVLFQEYNDKTFNEKVKLDNHVYNKLLENISEKEVEDVNKIIVEMLNDVKDIYKFINIEPKMLGFKGLSVGSPKRDLIIEASNIINKFIEKEYYNLSTKEKEIKYKEAVIHESANLVKENNLSPDDAITHSYKTIILENFIYSLNFPYIIKYKINEIIENNIYNDFFDLQELNELIESFEAKSKVIARISSVLIK